jgi:hypothetical protein
MTDATHMPTPPNSWPVQRYQLLSQQFIEAYRAYAARPSLARSRASGIDFPPQEVEMFLLYHALELALKGWLLLSVPGMTPKQLKKDYGHTLADLGAAVEPYYPTVRGYLPLMGELERWKYAYPDLSDDGYTAPWKMEPFAEFVSNCRFDLFNALAEANTRAQSHP